MRECGQDVVPTPTAVVRRFKALLRDFGENGTRRSEYTQTYSGKDLLIQINEELPSIGFSDFGGFREAIASGNRKRQSRSCSVGSGMGRTAPAGREVPRLRCRSLRKHGFY